MNKFWIVFAHTYLTKIKSKSFIITTAVMLVLIFGLSNVTKIIDYFDDNEKEKVAVVDKTDAYFELFKNTAETMNKELTVQAVPNEKEAEKQVADEEIIGYLLISEGSNGEVMGVYKANEISNTEVSAGLSTALNQLKLQKVKTELNLTDEQIEALNAPAVFETVALKESAKTEEDLNQARGLVYILLFVIYFSVLMYSSMIATEVATEKSSRVMEILISSIPPIQQMFAKILGVALLNFTQILLFLGVGYVTVKQNLAELNDGFFSVFGFGSIQPSILVYAVIFVLLGYLLYATLAACLGSIVSRVEDVQSMIMPMTTLIVIAFLIAMSGLSNPGAGYVTVTSFIPFFSPMIMFLRVGMLDVPFWQVLTSILILLGTIGLLAIIGARIYRGGVLMYGSSKSFKDIKEALKMSKHS